MPSLDSLINKATDPTLTSDNWQFILDVCDKISSDPESETKIAISTLKSKLASKDANVILRSLSLLTAIAENCGSRMKQEIATKSFLHDSLIKRLSDRKLHATVKYKICEVLTQLYNTFKADPSLKPMTDAYNKAKSDYPQYFKKQLEGPSKPAKKERTQQDKDKEEEELQRVLKLSLQEYEQQRTEQKEYLNNKPLPEVKQEPQSPPSETVATVSKVRAIYDLISYEPDELSFHKGDVITVIESVYRDWWRGSLPNGKIGIFPLNYVTPIVNKSPQEVAKELEMENRLVNVEKKKIEKLLAILSSQQIDSINEDEVTQLYNDIIPLRIQLGNAIDKYSVRKEELTLLNQSLNNEVKSYNEFLDKSIANRAQHHTGGTMYQSTPYPTQPQFQPQQQQQQQVPPQNTQPVPQQYTQNQQFPPPQHQPPQYSGYSSANPSQQPPPPTTFNQYVPPQLQQLQPQDTSAGFGNDSYSRPPPGGPY
ncbi:HSE1 Class E vacuolar protein-sorting machinery protein HSE1 [Candida maltosa Xu316]|uniref:Class E vacuolar protein-sorting machinery protein HSE1 n=1 Tax=Candida maltosa (strain Xu316) TaxID=1245528 RepID=M3HNC0_CANMX|nr:Class E vacuolar protein-sorting machinery protein HSE1 [Candida maltosa Xu316]